MFLLYICTLRNLIGLLDKSSLNLIYQHNRRVKNINKIMLPIITLTTDFGLKDFSVSAVKGSIYNELGDVRIVDISHLVSPYDVAEGAYIIKNSYKSFPKGTVHVIGIDAEKTIDKPWLVVDLDGHYFVCADNGIISLIVTDIRADGIYEITLASPQEPHFTVLGVLCKAACHLARGGKPEVIGRPYKNMKINKNVAPTVDEKSNIIYGHVLYVDNYDNVITNVSKMLFDQVGRGRSFSINTKGHTFTEILTSYSAIVNYDLPADRRDASGKKLALWNASGYLELAIYRSDKVNVGGAQTLLGIKVQDTVTIHFQ